MARNVFGENTRYLSALEGIRPDPLEWLTKRTKREGLKAWESLQGKILDLCSHMLNEVRLFGLPDQRSDIPHDVLKNVEGLKAATLSFDDSDSPLMSRDVAEFLHLFRAAYVFGMNFRDAAPESITPEFLSEFVQILQEFWSDGSFDALISADLAANELLITKISKESPLQIVMVCIIPALTVAVIISGGRINLYGMRFELPALGTGIVRLREAFGLPVNKKQGIENVKTQMKRKASQSAEPASSVFDSITKPAAAQAQSRDLPE